MCVDRDKLLYHFLVEGSVVKDGSKVQCDVGVNKIIFLVILLCPLEGD